MKRLDKIIGEVLSRGEDKEINLLSIGYHKLRTLCSEHTRTKTLNGINYKTELLSGVRLKPRYYFSDDGFLLKTVYSYEEEDILEVSEKYEYNKEEEADLSIPKSKRGVASRTKTWRYYLIDGTLDVSDSKGSFKIKQKEYETDLQALRVGKQRRNNIQVILSQRVGTLLLILGVFSTTKEVKQEMRKIGSDYSNSFGEYEKYGTEDIYEDIRKDTLYPWLNIKVPTEEEIISEMTEEAGQALLQALVFYDLKNVMGKTFREYFISKLRGDEK